MGRKGRQPVFPYLPVLPPAIRQAKHSYIHIY
jgi:hypothetical protein